MRKRCALPRQSKTGGEAGLFLVRGRGLEPPRLAAPAPKAGVSTISPPTRADDYTTQ